MRKLLVLLLILPWSLQLMAQIEVKEGSFKEVPGFVNINPDQNYQTDDNELPFAVIKVRTENITDKQRRELRFSGNAGTFIMLEYKDGEVWVYLTAKYADYLKISHPDFSSTEFTLPFDLKPKRGYELTLINKSPKLDKNNYLIIKVDQSNAKIYIDDELIGTGYASKVVSIGEEHTYKVSCDDYYPKEGLVYFDKREDKEINVTLEPSFGYITIKSEPSGADVYIDKVKVGTTPYLAERISIGQRRIEIKKLGYITFVDIVDIKVGDNNKQFEDVKLDEDENYLEQPEAAQTTENSAKTQILKIPTGDSSSYSAGFSVSPNKKVCFSKGNLQYQPSTKTWRFAEHQWDYIGEDNKNISSRCKSWIDLFGWGTGDKPTQKHWNSEKYSLFNDWGKNTISNGESRNWYTLTCDEWDYLINDRDTYTGVRYAFAIVNGFNGIILLPDNWNYDYILKISDLKFNSNIISLTDWDNVFERNGAVFLPTAGSRYNNEVQNVDIEGFYWSATTNENIETTLDDGLHIVMLLSKTLFFRDETIFLMGNMRSCGFSVRLVCDVE